MELLLNREEETPAPHCERKEMLRTVLSCANILLDTMNSILDYMKMEHISRNGARELVCTIFDLRDVISDVYRMFNNRKQDIRFKYRNYGFENVVGQITCRTDRVKLIEILMNVLSNAFKFTNSGSVELIMRRIDNHLVEFQVSDTGIGMSREFLSHLYQPFVQEPMAIGRKASGSGLGLSIVKRCVDLMKGTISCQSTSSGTTFTVTLPILMENETQTVQRTEQPNNSSFTSDNRSAMHDCTSLNVLVVDDNVLNRQIFSHMMKKLNVRHTCLSSGLEALDLIQREKFSDVLMDVEMPGISGLETARIIRESIKDKDLRLYFVTGSEEQAIQGYLQYANGFIQKPVHFGKMKQLLFGNG